VGCDGRRSTEMHHGMASRAHSPIFGMSMIFLLLLLLFFFFFFFFFFQIEQLVVIDTIYLRATEGRVVPINPILAMFCRYPNVMPQHHAILSYPIPVRQSICKFSLLPGPARQGPPCRPLLCTLFKYLHNSFE
jgi:hypothetical protein